MQNDRMSWDKGSNKQAKWQAVSSAVFGEAAAQLNTPATKYVLRKFKPASLMLIGAWNKNKRPITGWSDPAGGQRFKWIRAVHTRTDSKLPVVLLFCLKIWSQLSLNMTYLCCSAIFNPLSFLILLLILEKSSTHHHCNINPSINPPE